MKLQLISHHWLFFSGTAKQGWQPSLFWCLFLHFSTQVRHLFIYLSIYLFILAYLFVALISVFHTCFFFPVVRTCCDRDILMFIYRPIHRDTGHGRFFSYRLKQKYTKTYLQGSCQSYEIVPSEYMDVSHTTTLKVHFVYFYFNQKKKKK